MGKEIDPGKVPDDAAREAAEDTDFAQFYPRRQFNAEVGYFHDDAAGGKGYTVNLNSLAIRVGEMEAVADTVAEAVSHIPKSCADFGPGNLSAAVTEVFGEWQDNLGALRDKINEMGGKVKGAINDYHQRDLNAAGSFPVPGKDYDELRSGGRDRLKQKGGA